MPDSFETNPPDAPELPNGVYYSELPGAKRGVYQSNWCDAAIYWNDQRTCFVIVSGIVEVSMMNYNGLICWGQIVDHEVSVTKPNSLVCDVMGDVIEWLSDDIFAFKTLGYSSQKKRAYSPILIVKIDQGYWIDNNSSTLMIASEKGSSVFDLWKKPDHDLTFYKLTDAELKRRILDTQAQMFEKLAPN